MYSTARNTHFLKIFFYMLKNHFFFFLNSPIFKYDADTWFEGEEALTYEI